MKERRSAWRRLRAVKRRPQASGPEETSTDVSLLPLPLLLLLVLGVVVVVVLLQLVGVLVVLLLVREAPTLRGWKARPRWMKVKESF